ncbi:MAG TPA: hypothetical protein HA230_02930 [Candidatus Aenigmarchaeota archaeon]|nr:hypothetical protein [Candidatus Aenigmarchaeota archaeon]
MSAIRDHKKRINESMEAIEGAIAVGIEKRPVTIGFHASACAIEMLETYLHKEGKIPIGKMLKHDWFKRPLPEQKVEPLIERKLKVDFPSKEKVYDLIYTIEGNRTNLVYGRPTKTQIESVVNSFNKLKNILMERIGDLDE